MTPGPNAAPLDCRLPTADCRLTTAGRRPAAALMLQGTASHVGKSTLAAGLCRIFHRAGRRVAPFKSQNMSLNAAATSGGEIGRAQAVQAAACSLAPTVDMNPLLLKPTGPGHCELVLQGRAHSLRTAAEHGRYSPDIIAAILNSYNRLAKSADLMILEGAGSPAEINLLDRDVANMWMAERAEAKVLLVGDIERGGVFASLYGTWSLAPQRERIAGFIINKFRGDPALLTSGLQKLQDLTGVPVLGLIPYTDPNLPEEDSLGIPSDTADCRPPTADDLRIGVIRLPSIANFTDFEPLRRERGVHLRYFDAPAECDGFDVVILPGTKATVADLAWLRARAFQPALQRLARDPARALLGICGGYQMLGHVIRDPHALESNLPEVEGLGLLPVETDFQPGKRVEEVPGGYYIQYGRVTRLAGDSFPGEGCVQENVAGTSLHGLFDADGMRAKILAAWRDRAGKPDAPPTASLTLDQRLDAWADFLQLHLDIKAIGNLVGVDHV